MTTKATRRKRPHHVWVVEMWYDWQRTSAWFPCSSCAPTKHCAQTWARQFRERDPDDRFRVVRYERVEQ